MLDVQNISVKIKNKYLLESISFTLEEGEWLTIIGPSGAGKTTLLRAICGLSECDGTIKWNEEDISQVPCDKRNMKLVFSEPSLFQYATVRDNISLGLHKNHSNDEIDTLVDNIAKKLSISSLLQRKCVSLSQGEKQRVVLARALVDPLKILLLDEPFNALDKPLKEQLQKEIKQFCKENKITCIMVSHDQQDSFLYSDKVLVLKDGKVVELLKAKDHFQPSCSYTAKFIAQDFTTIIEKNPKAKEYSFFSNVLTDLSSISTLCIPLEAIHLEKDGKYSGRVKEIYPYKQGYIVVLYDDTTILYAYSCHVFQENSYVHFSISIEDMQMYQ